MAEDNVYILAEPQLEASQDYAALRKEGLEHIENLASKIWTDYNAHDPGITNLETLCYAITDLGYRTSFDIADILADESGSLKGHFFSARTILTCNPTNIADYRKILIDIEGLKNAWLEMAKEIEPKLYADCKNSELTFDYDERYKELVITGLYNVTLELDDDLELGDLNSYFIEFEALDNTVVIDLPAWDKLFAAGIKSDEIDTIAFQYPAGGDSTKLNVEVTLKDSSTKDFETEVTYKGKSIVPSGVAAKITAYLASAKGTTIRENYTKKLVKALGVVEDAFDLLHARRNLCEDFYQLKPIDIENIAVCTDLEVETDADLEAIWCEIMYALDKFLAPDVTFYTLKEMFKKDYPSEQIFEGPKLNHGFIDDEELAAAQIKTVINSSDLYQILMDIEGVISVKKLQLGSSYKGVIVEPGEKWCLEVSNGRAPRLDMDLSKITFYKDVIPYYADEKDGNQKLQLKNITERSQKLAYDQYDIEIPSGTYRDLKDYTSVQYELPEVYGVGKWKIPQSSSDKRKAQSKQLKGFMLMFDQILSNYLAQLSRTRDLLSFEPELRRTRHYQVPYPYPENADAASCNVDYGLTVDSTVENEHDHSNDEIPSLHQLIKAFVDGTSGNEDIDKYKTIKDRWECFKASDNTFVKALAKIAETVEDALERRNKILDHLLARFGEKFTDYVLLVYQANTTEGLKELIKDKEAFLKEYDVLSHDRGKAFDYNSNNLWNTTNVSGLAKRLSRLSGIDNYKRRFLHCDEIIGDEATIAKEADGKWYFTITENGVMLLKSIGYPTKKLCSEMLDVIITYGNHPYYYKRRKNSGGKYLYVFLDSYGNTLAESKLYNDSVTRDIDFQKLLDLLRGNCRDEGLHIIEHLLLRPKEDGNALMPVCIEPGCTDCFGNIDPYSFRITIILPGWLDRFSDTDFRTYFERLARLETPAHIHAKICWVDHTDLRKVEKAWRAWIKELKKAEPNDTLRKNLIIQLNNIKSIYPLATLHDCEEGEDENPVVLGNTILGSSKFN